MLQGIINCKRELGVGIIRACDLMNREVITVSPDAYACEVADIVTRKRIHLVPVVSAENKLVGVVTERDLLRGFVSPSVRFLDITVYLEQPHSLEVMRERASGIKVSNIMTSRVESVAEDTSLGKVIALVLEKNLHQIPVVREEEVVGLVSRSDIIRTIYSKICPIKRAGGGE
ncbi:MAG: CBS domain-containing protein [Bacillota bacterium]